MNVFSFDFAGAATELNGKLADDFDLLVHRFNETETPRGQVARMLAADADEALKLTGQLLGDGGRGT